MQQGFIRQCELAAGALLMSPERKPAMLAWKLFGIVTAFVLAADFLWLGLVMKGFYDREIGDLLRRSADGLSPRWGAAILVYVLIPAGVVLFVRPRLGDAGVWQTLGWGAAFGAILYGVYDLTNLAILEKWTLKVTLADILWGSALSAASALTMRSAERWLLK